jgi:Bacterial membrane protein YfhO
VRSAWRWCSARPVLSAAAVYAVLCLVFVGQGLLPGRTLSGSDMLWSTAPWLPDKPADVKPLGANYELADTAVVFQPFFQYTRRVLPDVPLWNAHIMGGRPFLADAQSAIFSPFTAPAYVLPFWRSLAVTAFLKLFVAAFGMFLFARTLGMRFGGALLAGVVYTFGTFFMAWLGWPLTNVFALIPWMLMLTELLVRRPGLLPGAGLAALVGLAFLGGHPETTFHVICVTVAWFAFRLLLGRRRAEGIRPLVRPALAFGLALGAGAALAAVMLVPLLELLVNSGDYARRANAHPSHTQLWTVGAFFLSDYWGRATQTPLEAIVTNRGFYAGGITLMLAAVALVLRPTATRVAFGVLAAFCLAVVLGADPIFSLLTKLPGFKTAHNGRMVIFILFALALLAGWGVDDLTERQLPALTRRRVALGAAAALFCVPFVWMLVAGTLELGQLGSALKIAWGFADPPPTQALKAPLPETVASIRLSALLQWLPLAGAGLALIALRLVPGGRRRLPAAAFVALAVGVVALDLFRANMGYNPAIPIEHAEQPATGAIRYLQQRQPNRFAAFNRPVIAQPLQPDLSMRYGLYDARGYDYPVVRRFDDFWRATAATPGEFIPPTTRAQPNERSLQGMSLLSVTDVLQDAQDDPVPLPGLRLAYRDAGARIYRNTNALPRAFLVERQRTVDGREAALAATLDPGFDARHAAVTERALPGLAQAGGSSPPAAGSARLTDYEDERAVVTTSAPKRSLLVLTDVHFPGWKATVDGEPADIEQVDYLLRGVMVPAGRHTVEFRYEPLSWRIGWIVSLIALLGVACAALVGWRRRRSPAPAP